MNIKRRGMLLVLSSPSGAGKTTLSRKILESDKNITMSVSVTTRTPRPGEVDGKDYHFISMDKFQEMAQTGKLLEWAEVFGNGYGTPLKPVEDWLSEGKDVLFDIDWQGTQQIAAKMLADLVRVFILPPEAKTLQERLIKRNQDSSSIVAKRMAEASNEISHWAEYDYVLINENVETCLAELNSVLSAERLKRDRRIGLDEFVKNLRASL